MLKSWLIWKYILKAHMALSMKHSPHTQKPPKEKKSGIERRIKERHASLFGGAWTGHAHNHSLLNSRYIHYAKTTAEVQLNTLWMLLQLPQSYTTKLVWFSWCHWRSRGTEKFNLKKARRIQLLAPGNFEGRCSVSQHWQVSQIKPKLSKIILKKKHSEKGK